MISEAKYSSENPEIFLDQSRYPEVVSYSVRCPACGKVHGDFSTMHEARLNAPCNECSLTSVENIKDEIRKVNEQPDKDVKPLADMSESEEDGDILPEDPQPDSDFSDSETGDIGDIGNVSDFIDNTQVKTWIEYAKIDLAEECGYEVDDIEVKSSRGRFSEVDAEIDKCFRARVSGSNVEYLVFKDYNAAYAATLEVVTNELTDSPEVWKKDFIEDYIDDDKVKEFVGDPNQDERDGAIDKDFPEKIEFLADIGAINRNDQAYFNEDGEPLDRDTCEVEEKDLDQMIEDHFDDIARNFDAMQYLKDCYGDQEVYKVILDNKMIDIAKAAKAAIAADGMAHFMAHYDHNEIQLRCGAYAFRTN